MTKTKEAHWRTGDPPVCNLGTEYRCLDASRWERPSAPPTFQTKYGQWRRRVKFRFRRMIYNLNRVTGWKVL